MSLIGIGIDLVEIKKIKLIYKKNPKFPLRILSNYELHDFYKKKSIFFFSKKIFSKRIYGESFRNWN